MCASRVDLKAAKLIYGTAWKKGETASLVEKAVLAGFRAIDTACQPKHYNEEGVGRALAALREKHGIFREDIFVQTKFSPVSGQDEHVPYDANEPISTQVLQSFEKSKSNLGTPYVDSLILHSPYPVFADTLLAWRAMESIHIKGEVRQLGISNIYNLAILKKLYDQSTIKPSVVQNRFYENSSYDIMLRAWCREKGIRYQSFWTLTANPHILSHGIIQQAATRHSKTPQQILFRYLVQRDVDPLTGTQSVAHMKEDLDVFSFALSMDETAAIDALLIRASA